MWASCCSRGLGQMFVPIAVSHLLINDSILAQKDQLPAYIISINDMNCLSSTSLSIISSPDMFYNVFNIS
jgi:hypothetical protein